MSIRTVPRPRLLVAESRHFAAEARALLEPHWELALEDVPPGALPAALGDAEVLWVRLRHRIDAAVLDAGPALRCIVSPTTGLNHIDLDAAAARGVTVLSLRGEVEFLKDVRATAEHTIGLLLAMLRHVPEAVEHARHGGWNRDLFRGREIYGRTVGLVGYGRLGRIVARYLAAFGARVLVTDPAVQPSDVEPPAVLVSLEELLGRADIVSLHVSYDPAAHGWFGAPHFGRMRPGSWFVNTARGEVVDETALLDALRSGRLAGAAVDVASGEAFDGMGEHPLVRFASTDRRLLLTPHIGGNTAESLEKAETFMAGKLVRVAREASRVIGAQAGPPG